MKPGMSAIEATKSIGPEDRLVVRKESTEDSWRVGARTSVVPMLPTTPAEQEEIRTLQAFILTPPYAGIVSHLCASRNLCAKESFLRSACLETAPAHLAASTCASQDWDLQKCKMKVCVVICRARPAHPLPEECLTVVWERAWCRRARVVQRDCWLPVKALAACYRRSGADPTAPAKATDCFKEFLAFDRCTEEY